MTITKSLSPKQQAPLAGVTADILRDAKTRFLADHRDRCGYLRITFAPADNHGAMVISALFTLQDDREWHNADARIDLRDLLSNPEAAVTKAFATLDDAIATVGIAQLFRPRGAETGLQPRRL